MGELHDIHPARPLHGHERRLQGSVARLRKADAATPQKPANLPDPAPATPEPKKPVLAAPGQQEMPTAKKGSGIKITAKFPLAIKNHKLYCNGLPLDVLDPDEKFIIYDLIRDYGFEVLRSTMGGTVNDIDKVVAKLRTVIPRSLEIIDTPLGWKLQERKVEHAM